MLLARIQPYLNMLIRYLSELIIDPDACGDTVQAHLYAFWTHLDNITLLLPLPLLPIQESRFYLSRLWQELQALEQLTFSADVRWMLNRLRCTLVMMSNIIDEHLSRRFELPAVTAQPRKVCK